MREIKSKVLLLSILVMSLAMSNQVTSYTTAKVANSANINISTSENALIASPEDIKLDLDKLTTITKIETIRDNSSETAGSLNSISEYKKEKMVELSNKDFSFDIKNNMHDYISVVVFLDRDISTKNQGVRIKNSGLGLSIAPGKTEEVKLEVDETIESKTIDVLINVKWDGGSAEIKKSIDIEVNNIEHIDYELVDLRKNIVALDSNNIVKDINEAEGQAEPGQAEPGQAEPGQAEPAKEEPAKEESEQTESEQTEPEQKEPVQEESKQDVPEQEETKQIELSEIISETDEESNSN